MAMGQRMALGLLLLALLLPTQEGLPKLLRLRAFRTFRTTGGENGTTVSPANSTSSVTSVPLSTLNITTPAAHGNSLQSTTGLFILAISLLYVC
ncbi:hypothetical protein JD844_024286 [Phrynosoma platyrhinos]|uniref:Signal transducer CD24 n=1 Tax=Phrynosoma platyrhinos TaxID=52577 RepID=A0ABQ7SXZ9_PHRPL|nr:hypothetical protein JD844_024286 [Phrynosoma platyrhinos]